MISPCLAICKNQAYVIALIYYIRKVIRTYDVHLVFMRSEQMDDLLPGLRSFFLSFFFFFFFLNKPFCELCESARPRIRHN